MTRLTLDVNGTVDHWRLSTMPVWTCSRPRKAIASSCSPTTGKAFDKTCRSVSCPTGLNNFYWSLAERLFQGCKMWPPAVRITMLGVRTPAPAEDAKARAHAMGHGH